MAQLHPAIILAQFAAERALVFYTFLDSEVEGVSEMTFATITYDITVNTL